MGTGSHISRTCLESQLYFWNNLTGSNFFRKFNETLQGQFSLSLFLVLTSPPCSFPAPIAEAWLWGVCDLAAFLQGFERNPLRSEDTGLEGCPELGPRPEIREAGSPSGWSLWAALQPRVLRA